MVIADSSFKQAAMGVRCWVSPAKIGARPRMKEKLSVHGKGIAKLAGFLLHVAG
jgi:hypothetical protein